MFYYNPYYMPYTYASKGIFSNIFKGINFTSILNGASKTLNVVNQAIPVFKEISPMIKNTKTMFRIVNEFNKEETPKANVEKNAKQSYNEGPTFFQ